MEGLLLLLFGLFVIAAIGHGLWVLGAMIMRPLLGIAPDDPRGARAGSRSSHPGDPCPRCSMPLSLNSCDACNWPREATASPRRRRQIALASLRRSAKRFFGMGWLDADVYRELDAALERQLVPASAPIPLADAPVEFAPAAAIEPIVETPPATTPNVATSEITTAPQPTTNTAAPAEPPAPEEKVFDLAEAAATVPFAPPVEPAARQETPKIDVPERVAAYMAARREVDVPKPAVKPAIVAPPREPAKPFSRILASFMEEKNIRWGELIGGLLILCSSIALVLSFWQQIAERPLLKFGLFNGVTAALFGIGLYVERRWRLPTTTHGLLLIAMLLVPLNFLAIAAFTLERPPTDAR
ncbi:MAG: hypothetical protein QM775_00145 [Pirellulales bacterium]